MDKGMTTSYTEGVIRRRKEVTESLGSGKQLEHHHHHQQQQGYEQHRDTNSTLSVFLSPPLSFSLHPTLSFLTSGWTRVKGGSGGDGGGGGGSSGDHIPANTVAYISGFLTPTHPTTHPPNNSLSSEAV